MKGEPFRINFRTALPLFALQLFLCVLLTFSNCTHRITIKKQLKKTPLESFKIDFSHETLTS